MIGASIRLFVLDLAGDILRKLADAAHAKAREIETGSHDANEYVEAAAPPQDPLTPEAEELLWRESTRAGETPDAEPPAVHERRVRRA